MFLVYFETFWYQGELEDKETSDSDDDPDSDGSAREDYKPAQESKQFFSYLKKKQS